MSVLKRRLGQNLTANMFGLGTMTLVQFVSVPLFLVFWSKERYGEWILLSSVPIYLSLAEAALTSVAINEISMFAAEGNMMKAQRSLHTAWGFLVAIVALIFVVAMAASYLIPWTRWLSLTTLAPNEAQEVVQLLTAYTMVGILLTIFWAIYRAAYRNPRMGYLTSAGRLVELGATAFCIINSSSMVALAGALLAVRLLTFLVTYFDSRRISPGLQLGFKDFSFAEVRRTWRPSLLFMAFPFGNALYFQGLTILAGIGLGPAAVVVFNTTRMLTRVIVQFMTIIKHSAWPEFSYLFGASDLTRARRLNGLAFEVTGCASIALALVLYVTAPWLMAGWTHRMVEPDRLVLGLLLMSAVLNSLWSTSSGLLMGINQHEGLALWYLFASAFALILGWVLLPWLGLTGIGMAMIACEAILLPYTIKAVCRALQMQPKTLLLDSLKLVIMRETLSHHLKSRKWGKYITFSERN